MHVSPPLSGVSGVAVPDCTYPPQIEVSGAAVLVTCSAIRHSKSCEPGPEVEVEVEVEAAPSWLLPGGVVTEGESADDEVLASCES